MRYILKLRIILALLLGKVVTCLIKWLGQGRGSSLPGKLALRIYPDLLQHFANQPRLGTIMITGTNGKTTTSNMLAGILELGGHKVLTNREGANLIAGITTVFVKASSLISRRVNCDYAVLEVDEAAFALVVKAMQPQCVVVTNFFHDQLDRYGNLETTINHVLTAMRDLPKDTALMLNADDPRVASLMGALDHKSIFYGIHKDAIDSKSGSSTREAGLCPFCGHVLFYKDYIYGQLGDYRCYHCGFIRPQTHLEVISTATTTHGATALVHINASAEKWTINLPVLGIYNLYNALAAFTAAYFLEVDPKFILAGLQEYNPATGRTDYFKYGHKQAVLVLVKNATGFNQALSGMSVADAGQDLLIAINDRPADGRDVSWLWDVDFEMLAQQPEQFKGFICSGQRAADVALRLKYAGLPTSLIQIEYDLQRAVELSLNGSGEAVSILVNYTALGPVEKKLMKQAERVELHAHYRLSSVS